ASPLSSSRRTRPRGTRRGARSARPSSTAGDRVACSRTYGARGGAGGPRRGGGGGAPPGPPPPPTPPPRPRRAAAAPPPPPPPPPPPATLAAPGGFQARGRAPGDRPRPASRSVTA